MYGWNDRPYKVESRTRIEGDDPRNIYEIGRYNVAIHDDGSVAYWNRYGHSSDPRSVMPNMDVVDGEIRIPVSDLVGEALKRLEPADLAKALWVEREVRDEFMDMLTNHYYGEMDDGERRIFLTKVQSELHDRIVDKLADKMASLEYNLSKKWYLHDKIGAVNHYIRHINEILADKDVRRSDGEPLQFSDVGFGFVQDEDNDPDFKIGGTSWNEARAFWRKEIVERFPGPADDTETDIPA